MNTQIRSIIFAFSAILILAGAVLYLTNQHIAPYLFAFGAAGYALSYITISPKDMNFRQKRLHNYNVLAGLLMIVASGLMFSERKEWIICLTIAAIFQTYTAFVNPKSDK